MKTSWEVDHHFVILRNRPFISPQLHATVYLRGRFIGINLLLQGLLNFTG